MKQNPFGLIVIIFVLFSLFSSTNAFRVPFWIILVVLMIGRSRNRGPNMRPQVNQGILLIGLLVIFLMPMVANFQFQSTMTNLPWFLIIPNVAIFLIILVVFANIQKVRKNIKTPPRSSYDEQESPFVNPKQKLPEYQQPKSDNMTTQCPSCGFYTDSRFNICTKCGKRVTEW